MDIKAILAKVIAGETLTDEEKAAIKEIDLDKTANSAAAAARKKAEADVKAAKERVAELEAQLADAGNEGKTELEKAQKAIEKLTKAIADKDAAIAKGEAERKKSVRDSRIAKILTGIKLMDGIDPELARMALERSLADVGDDDLESDDAVRPAIEAFTTKNKALIVGDAGGGAGTPPKNKPGAGAPVSLDGIETMSSDEFQKNKDALWAKSNEVK